MKIIVCYSVYPAENYVQKLRAYLASEVRFRPKLRYFSVSPYDPKATRSLEAFSGRSVFGRYADRYTRGYSGRAGGGGRWVGVRVGVRVAAGKARRRRASGKKINSSLACLLLAPLATPLSGCDY